MMLIDPPSPFSPTEEWQRFLAEMEALRDAGRDDADVRFHIDMAEAVLRERRAL